MMAGRGNLTFLEDTSYPITDLLDRLTALPVARLLEYRNDPLI